LKPCAIDSRIQEPAGALITPTCNNVTTKHATMYRDDSRTLARNLTRSLRQLKAQERIRAVFPRNLPAYRETATQATIIHAH